MKVVAHRHVGVGVGENRVEAAFLGPVEERYRRGDRDRRLFGEDDDRVPNSLADDRAGTGAAGRRHGGRLQFPRGAERQAGGVDRAVLVELEGDRLQDRRVVARKRRELAATVEFDRRVVVLGQRFGRKPPWPTIMRSPATSSTRSILRTAFAIAAKPQESARTVPIRSFAVFPIGAVPLLAYPYLRTSQGRKKLAFRIWSTSASAVALSSGPSLKVNSPLTWKCPVSQRALM